MAKDKLLIPIRENLFEDFLKNHLKIDEEVGEYFKKFDDSQIRDINLILRRVKLSDNIHSDEISTEINKGIGMFEEGALRMHLYLTCIESLARMLSENSFLNFGNWINANKEPYKTEKENVVIGENISDEKIASEFYKKYSSIHGTKTMFYHFFNDGLTKEQKENIFPNLFVLELNPLPKVYHIYSINPGEKEYKNDDFKRIAIDRKKWDSSSIEIQTSSISKALYSIRNHFTHSLIPYTSVQDKTGNFDIRNPQLINRGDTVFVWEENIAIGSNWYPMNHYLKAMVLAGLENYIKKTNLGWI